MVARNDMIDRNDMLHYKTATVSFPARSRAVASIVPSVLERYSHSSGWRAGSTPDQPPSPFDAMDDRRVEPVQERPADFADFLFNFSKSAQSATSADQFR
jgi:hypothetical protein